MSKNPQRILQGRYQVVPRTIIFLIRDGLVLLQKAPETKKIFPGYYNGIGGHVERGEDVYHGAVRELREEAGISCGDLALYGTVMIDVEEEQGILLFVFSGSDVKGDIHSSDEGTLHWVEISGLSSIKVVEDIPELVDHIQRARKSGRLFFGKYLYDGDGKRITTWLEQ
jgi:8-oxo-dGTP diphosphatase